MALIFAATPVARADSAFAPGPEARLARARAGIAAGDAVNDKIAKALRLLNDEHYFEPVGPPGKEAPIASVYALDSLRTAEQILGQKRGGNCGSAALAFAAILEASGVSDEDIRIVGGVVNEDLELLCPAAGRPRVAHASTEAPGHMFVLVRTGAGWTLVNTVDSASRISKSPLPGPTELQAAMARQPVAIPTEAFQTILEVPEARPIYLSGMTIFGVWRVGEVPRHTLDGRLNLVASGDPRNATCRYAAADIEAARLRTLLPAPRASQAGRAQACATNSLL